MAAAPLPIPPIGAVTPTPPTFMEFWGVIFLTVLLIWLLGESGWLIYVFVHSSPSLPNLTGLGAADAKTAIENHKLVAEEWRSPISFIFDTTVTKTILPLVTLLFGYLFGKKTA